MSGPPYYPPTGPPMPGFPQQQQQQYGVYGAPAPPPMYGHGPAPPLYGHAPAPPHMFQQSLPPPQPFQQSLPPPQPFQQSLPPPQPFQQSLPPPQPYYPTGPAYRQHFAPTPPGHQMAAPAPPRQPGGSPYGVLSAPPMRPGTLLGRPSAPPASRSIMVFIGQLSPRLDQVSMVQLLSQCGPVINWTRIVDPVANRPKPFGFVQFGGVAGAINALDLLEMVEIDGRELHVRIDRSAQGQCDAFRKEQDESVAPGDTSPFAEQQVQKLIIIRKILSDRQARLDADAPAPGPARGGTGPGPILTDERTISFDPKQPPPPPPPAAAPTPPPPPAASTEVLEFLDETTAGQDDAGAPAAAKKSLWKKSSSAKPVVLAPALETFAKAQTEQSDVSKLYTAQREMEIRPLMATKPQSELRAMVPPLDDTAALFSFPFDWTRVDRRFVVRTTIAAWIDAYVVEYLGQAEPDLSQFVLALVDAGKTPAELLDQVAPVFCDDSAAFVGKLWSELAFQYLSQL